MRIPLFKKQVQSVTELRVFLRRYGVEYPLESLRAQPQPRAARRRRPVGGPSEEVVVVVVIRGNHVKFGVVHRSECRVYQQQRCH